MSKLEQDQIDAEFEKARRLDYLAGAAAEREAIIKIVADNYPSETEHAMMAVARINYLIRQRREACE